MGDDMIEDNVAGVITNYRGADSFMRNVSNHDMAMFYRSKVAASARTDAPRICLDFRYKMTRDYVLKSLYRQLVHFIANNRRAVEPFQLHFCNYDTSDTFHSTYAYPLCLDGNLIEYTKQSYMDIFPRKDLVYLSRDAHRPMKAFDPSKVYIIGAMIDNDPKEFRLASYTQAKKDGIECQSLPIDQHVNWSMGSKNLTLNLVIQLLNTVYSTRNWKDAFASAHLPARKIKWSH